LKDPRAVPILLSLLQDKDVNHVVSWSLGEIGNKALIQPLIETLKDPDPDMRVLAIYALESSEPQKRCQPFGS
jgi:HEAT repeat protein